MYRINPDNITYRFKKVMRAAGFLDLGEDASEEREYNVGDLETHFRDRTRPQAVEDTFKVSEGIYLVCGISVEGRESV